MLNVNKIYYDAEGRLHREDGPAIEHPNGTKEWYVNGKLHRVGGPAIEHPNGSKLWYDNGKRHREDGPAIIYSNGGKLWYLNGIQVDSFEVIYKINWLKDGF